jgi:hypothetical protein
MRVRARRRQSLKSSFANPRERPCRTIDAEFERVNSASQEAPNTPRNPALHLGTRQEKTGAKPGSVYQLFSPVPKASYRAEQRLLHSNKAILRF